MKENGWLKMGLGMMAGAAVGFMMAPKKKDLKKTAKKAIRAVENGLDTASDAMGL